MQPPQFANIPQNPYIPGMQQPGIIGGQNVPGQPYFPSGSQLIRLQFDPKVRKFNKEFLNPTVIGLDNVQRVNDMIHQIETLPLLEEENNLKLEHRGLMNKKPMANVLSLCLIGLCWLYQINVRQTTIRHRRNEIRHLFRTETQNICQKYNQMYFSAQGIFATYRTEILLVPSPDAPTTQLPLHHHHHHHLQEQLIVQDPQTNNMMLEDMIEEGILELFVPYGFKPVLAQQQQQFSQPLSPVLDNFQQNFNAMPENINVKPQNFNQDQAFPQMQQQYSQNYDQNFAQPQQFQQQQQQLQQQQQQQQQYQQQQQQQQNNLNLDYPVKPLSDEEHQQFKFKSQIDTIG